MGQKTNPNIFRLGKTNNWKSKYFEKKITEYSIYSKKDLEIKNFIYTFFKNQKIRITIHDCKMYYLQKSLHIFISYHQNLDWLSLSISKTKVKKSKISKKIRCIKKKKPDIETFLNRQIIYKTKKKIKNKTLKIQKAKTYKINRNLKMKLFIKKMFESLKMKLLIGKFFESLTNFTLKKFKLFLMLQQLNNNIEQTTKKKSVQLRKYRNNKFFQEGIKILFTCATNKKSSKLLAQFIAIQLKNLKQHNFFLRFIKDALSLFKKNIFSRFKGIKIKVKGRLNGRPRARNRVIKIANSLPVLTLNSNINYSEATAFTPNGTFGVKVWIHELLK